MKYYTSCAIDNEQMTFKEYAAIGLEAACALGCFIGLVGIFYMFS